MYKYDVLSIVIHSEHKMICKCTWISLATGERRLSFVLLPNKNCPWKMSQAALGSEIMNTIHLPRIQGKTIWHQDLKQKSTGTGFRTVCQGHRVFTPNYDAKLWTGHGRQMHLRSTQEYSQIFETVLIWAFCDGSQQWLEIQIAGGLLVQWKEKW